MPPGIEGVGPTQITPQQAADAQQAAPLVGEYRGQKVVSGGPSQSSLVQDSLEELPANLSEKKSKKLAERKARTRGASRAQEIFDKYLKRVDQVEQPEKFQQLAETLKKAGQLNAGQIRERLREFLGGQQQGNLDGGETALLLALEELVAAEGGNEQLLGALREAKTELGTNLRDFYEQQVQFYEGTTEVYQQLLGQYGAKDFMDSAEMMIKKLGHDVQAQGSAIDATELKAKLDTLYHLEVARNTYLAFRELANKMTQFPK